MRRLCENEGSTSPPKRTAWRYTSKRDRRHSSAAAAACAATPSDVSSTPFGPPEDDDDEAVVPLVKRSWNGSSPARSGSDASAAAASASDTACIASSNDIENRSARPAAGGMPPTHSTRGRRAWSAASAASAGSSVGAKHACATTTAGRHTPSCARSSGAAECVLKLATTQRAAAHAKCTAAASAQFGRRTPTTTPWASETSHGGGASPSPPSAPDRAPSPTTRVMATASRTDRSSSAEKVRHAGDGMRSDASPRSEERSGGSSPHSASTTASDCGHRCAAARSQEKTSRAEGVTRGGGGDGGAWRSVDWVGSEEEERLGEREQNVDGREG